VTGHPFGVPVLGWQTWDTLGLAGQAIFTWRILEQWIASEKARRTILPPRFWIWSLVGSVLLVVYNAYRREPVFMLSALVNGSLYARNFWMSRAAALARAKPHPALWPVAVGLLLFGGVCYEALGPDHGLVRFDYALPWLAAGFAGQVLWSGRFVVQWWVSERLGRSVLPPAFFWMGLVGSVLSFAYAVYRLDVVNMLAYGLSPLPYARNLVLHARHQARVRAGLDADDGAAGVANGPRAP
jgi:lipid-A-disaccharide synthase-like uncharacterized protein